MMFQSYINFFLLILIAIRLDILTKFGVNLFCILPVVGMIGHEVFDYLKKGDKNDETD
jgi:hypothetical protein|nr:MAG TPA: hypothetical protein [Caudoviricetes sp.]